MAGFFKASELKLVKAPTARVPQCGACGLDKTCKSPKMPPTGKGGKRILIVAEAPDKDEDAAGKQLVGVSGQMLSETLSRCGVYMRQDCWLTNALICRPPGNVIKDKRAVEYCRPNLLRTVEELSPEVIILLGDTAVKSLIGHLWKEDCGDINRWAGFQIPSQAINAWICPTYHPSDIMQEREREAPVLRALFERHLEAAVKLDGRPWRKVPNYQEQVEVLVNPEEAAAALDEILSEEPGTIAFDFETDRLKPDNKASRIICCSVCWEGKRTIAFPWIGGVVPRMTRLLTDKRWRKIGFNIKFEDRWVRARLGVQVKGWIWDGMIASHVLDCRPDITGLKFQAFALLGQPSYNDHIENLFRPTVDGGNNQNRIAEVRLKDLLIYCGMDSLLEYKVGKIQMEAIGYES